MEPRPRLESLDGIRGLSALLVVLHHAAYEIQEDGLSSLAALARRGLVDYGHYAVAVFIVLSGFSLTIPVARDPAGRLRGGVLGYLRRRARRILPPYYAAMGLCLALAAATPGLRHPSGARWDLAMPIFEPRVVLSHLLLVHNLNRLHMFAIDPPLWSVAAEWQIYFLFPLLIAARRRLGVVLALGVGGLASWLLALADAGPSLVMPPWYPALFALGMAGAVVAFSDDPGPRRASGLVPWGPLAALLGAAAMVLHQAFRDLGSVVVEGAIDPLVGGSIASLLIHCGRAARAPGPGPTRPSLAGFLRVRALVGLGGFSYSLYLIHFPLLSTARLAILDSPLGPSARLATMLLVASPLAILAAYLFHLAVERRFLPGHPRARPRAVPVAALSPAP